MSLLGGVTTASVHRYVLCGLQKLNYMQMNFLELLLLESRELWVIKVSVYDFSGNDLVRNWKFIITWKRLVVM